MATTLVTITPATEDSPRWLVLGEDNAMAWYVEVDGVATAPTATTCLLKRGSTTVQTVTMGGAGGTVTATFTAAAMTAGGIQLYEWLQVSLSLTIAGKVEHVVEDLWVTDLRIRPTLTASDLSVIASDFGGTTPCYPSGQTSYRPQIVLAWKMVMRRAVSQGIDRHPTLVKDPDAYRIVHLWQTSVLLAGSFASGRGSDSRWRDREDTWARYLDQAWQDLEARVRVRSSTQHPNAETDVLTMRMPEPLRLGARDPRGWGRA